MKPKTIGIIALVLVLIFGGLYAAGHFYGRAILYHPTREIVAPDIEGVESIRLHTSDGETLVAWWHKPPPGQPVMLFFDGNGGRPQIQDGRWTRIIAHDVGFLAVYYRGYAGSTGRPTEHGLINDARAGYDWLIQRGYQPHDIVIHGFSLGTAVAVQLAAEKPARALILEAPMTGVDDIAADRGAGAFAGIMQDSFRSRNFIGRVHMPVLIAHGDHDSVIPFTQGERMFALANQPKQFIRFPGSDHSTLVRDGLYDRIWPFLDAYPAPEH